MSCKNVMHDGRAFTDYQPNCQLNEAIKSQYVPGSSSEYRMFLQRNACRIMDEMRKSSSGDCVNPTGCVCNYNHPPHDPAHTVKYSWSPSAGFLHRKNSPFNQCVPAPGKGRWTNFC